MPLPLTVSCFSKIQIRFTFLVPAHPGRPRQRAVKRVRVYYACLTVCVCVCKLFPFLYSRFVLFHVLPILANKDVRMLCVAASKPEQGHVGTGTVKLCLSSQQNLSLVKS